MRSRIDRNFKRSVLEARLRYALGKTLSDTADMNGRPERKLVKQTKRSES
jgi:hypothetical protein